jgi:hypothetical protein
LCRRRTHLVLAQRNAAPSKEVAKLRRSSDPVVEDGPVDVDAADHPGILGLRPPDVLDPEDREACLRGETATKLLSLDRLKLLRLVQPE